ncbi:alpha/beta fold hydrolase (plasmid) [Streptomyces cynarae]|uniref:Alpha/beta fold hydrolase n=1 Tax=Streptomyces cynarae TaxID=2981134 RepID=A0ABY6EE39_9ACTN|nr:alpha/beta fold hydrolase [Streptomyces cynarae]UXY24897.1 alpha/beta fold hydrolase [Streptomyces cynarae]
MTRPAGRHEHSGWIRRYHDPSGDGPAVVCFPHAGGSAASFFRLSAELSRVAEVLIVQYPGRQDRMDEPVVDDIRELADHVAGALLPWRERPLALFGHSMGSVVAFETALRLERDPGRADPMGLIASGRTAPSVRRDQGVHRRDDAGIVAAMAELSGTDPALFADEEMLAVVIPPVRSDYRAVETYRCDPGTLLRCPITAYGGDADPHVSRHDLTLWGGHTASVFATRVFPGGHFYLQPGHNEVVAALGRDLYSFEAGHGGVSGRRGMNSGTHL